MFRKKRAGATGSINVTTLIASDVHIVGNVEHGEGLRIDGRITGNIVGKAGSQTLLVVSEQGVVDGDVRGYDVVVNGTITGDVSVEHFVELQSQARVTGNIAYQQLRMDCGAAVDGKLTRRDKVLTLEPVIGSPTKDRLVKVESEHSESDKEKD
ncbi:polymer-forming cytoskeletal protein [Burkholderia sp. JSH-S8]|nr:polymer-forming cytoskeletal protein [Burkholderia sp. JSH-S8]